MGQETGWTRDKGPGVGEGQDTERKGAVGEKGRQVVGQETGRIDDKGPIRDVAGGLFGQGGPSGKGKRNPSYQGERLG